MLSTTPCTARNVGTCSAFFYFINADLGIQTVKFTVATDNDYNSASITDTFIVNPKPESSVVIRLPGGGAVPTSISGRDQSLTVVATITGSKGAVTAYTTPNINVSTLAPILCSGRNGTCGLNFLFKLTATQSIVFEVAEDVNYKGAKGTKSISVTVPDEED